MIKTALISGITGQDGSYLAEFLLSKGCKVYGILPHRNNPDFRNIESCKDEITLIPGDMLDPRSIYDIVKLVQPDECYNLAAQSFVGKSWEMPVITSDINFRGVLYLLEAVRQLSPYTRVYQASTSEMFGNADPLQSELTVLNPCSPYGVSKAAAHMAVKNYRESYGLFACSGIMFNHESRRRGEQFVTQKIAKAVVDIKLERQKKIKLGNLTPIRDWGYAPEYIEAMWLMLQQDEPDDYVIGTGEAHSVREFLRESLLCAGLVRPWQDYVELDPALLRPVDVLHLQADISKAKEKLGWSPEVKFTKLISKLVEHWTRKLQCPN